MVLIRIMPTILKLCKACAIRWLGFFLWEIALFVWECFISFKNWACKTCKKVFLFRVIYFYRSRGPNKIIFDRDGVKWFFWRRSLRTFPRFPHKFSYPLTPQRSGVFRCSNWSVIIWRNHYFRCFSFSILLQFYYLKIMYNLLDTSNTRRWIFDSLMLSNVMKNCC